MPMPTTTDLERAKDNLTAFDSVVNGSASTTVTMPGGSQVKSIAKAIADMHDEFLEQTVTDGATVTWDLDNKKQAKVTIQGSRNLTTSGTIYNGFNYQIVVVQGTGGGHTITHDVADFEWGEEGEPDMSFYAEGQYAIFSYRATAGKLHGSYRGPFG